MAADHDHDHDHHHDHHHDHDHDHDHDDDELSEEEQQLAEEDVARMAEALAALDDEALGAGLDSLPEKMRAELAGHLNLPRATMHLGDALIPLVRRKLRHATPDNQLQVAFAITKPANDDTVAALGDRSEDPTRDDLLEVLPPVVAGHGAPLVVTMMAAYAASDAPCRPVMRELLLEDERFAIGPPIAIEDAGASLFTQAPKVVDKAKKEQRKAAKEAKKIAAVKEREALRTAQESRRAAVHKAKRKTR